MSYRGRGGRGGGRGGRGGGRGGRRGPPRDMGPPSKVVEVGQFQHACENELVCKSTHKDVPYFNAFIYLENKSKNTVSLKDKANFFLLSNFNFCHLHTFCQTSESADSPIKVIRSGNKIVEP